MTENEFRLIGSDLEQLRLDPTAEVRYDLMSDALVWSDERLRNRKARELWCMRAVFRYRTGLILGVELEEFREAWNLAKTAFPNWIGFTPERCNRNVSLEAEYRRLSRKP
jgi:hypothetical protein